MAMSDKTFRYGNQIGRDKVRVHRGGNRLAGGHDHEMFFADLPVPRRSNVDLSFDRKLSFDMAELVPVLCQECVPGDTFHIAQHHNIVMAPLVAPIYHRLDYKTWYFFVPTRLLWEKWKDFITYKITDVVPPYFTGKDIATVAGDDDKLYGQLLLPNSLLDYFDLPVHMGNFKSNLRHICAFPFRAYNLIWNEYFRDELKQPELYIYKLGGAVMPNELKSYVKRNIGWEKDYFTTANIEPQFGPDVPIPVGVEADGTMRFRVPYLSGDINGSERLGLSTNKDVDGNYYGVLRAPDGTNRGQLEYAKGLATTGTINDLRIANHLQRYRDKLQIAGARYNEAILAEFGVVVPDYRIQRPEYIGGFSNALETGRVLQTTPTADSPLGSFGGQGLGNGRMDYIHYTCYEHGYIIGISTVVPRSGYDQGIPRMFKKDDIFDFYHPDFAQLGDQEILNDEIYISDNSDTNKPDDSRFGYQQRYAEYKYAMDKTNGEFRTSLNYWHMNRIFDSKPALNSDFIECEPTNRVFAVEDDGANKLYAEIYQEIKAVRPMPISVVPTLEND
jgi:hypothetical protein